MKIDSHQHFWKYDPQIHGWIPDSMAKIRKDFLPQDLKPVLQENGIDGTVIVQAEQSERETEYLLDLAGEHSFIKGVVGWIDLTSQNAEERLEVFAEDRMFKGVRHTVWDEQGEYMLDPSFQEGISHLGKFGLTYDILAFDYQLAAAVSLVEKFPDQAFVLDHLGKPKISEGICEVWIENIKRLGAYRNVFCKISGLFAETRDLIWSSEDFVPFLKTVEEAFGTDRLMYGSNWPVSLTAASYQETLKVIEEYFSEAEDKQKIFGKNAAVFYNL